MSLTKPITAAALAFSIMIAGSCAEAVTIFNPGTDSCGSWVAQPNGIPRYLRVAWLAGFVSGYNSFWYRPGEDVTSDVNGLVIWIDGYCSAHPLDLLVKAAGQLVDELRRRKGLPSIVNLGWQP